MLAPSEMALSQAIATGRTLLCPISAGRTAPTAKDGEGCALDMAVAAVGRGHSWLDAPELWPWLEYRNVWGRYFEQVFNKFDVEVMVFKTMTMDAFIDWVKEIEPQVAATPVPTEVEVFAEVAR